MAESKKGHNFAILGPTEKKVRVCLFYLFIYFFFADATDKISRSYTILFPTYNRHVISQKGINSGNFLCTAPKS